MLKRKINLELENWFNNRKQALLITGARQVGKTYSINEFIKKKFNHIISINFAIQNNLIDLFCDLNDSNQLLINLSAIDGKNLIPNETVIFLDEIQLLFQRRNDLKLNNKLSPNSLDIITAMKAMVLDGRYRFILSGSLLGVSLNDILLTPTGYMDTIQMYPLDFEEFILNKGIGVDSINYLRDCFINKKQVYENINTLFLNYFKEYVLIGGMPEVVNEYINNQNLYNIQVIQEQISNAYKLDISNYIIDNNKKLRIREIYDAIPSELNSKNKRFVNSHIFDKSLLKRNDLIDEFLWLNCAAITIPTYNVTEPILPLALACERKTIKLFLNDIGLLNSMMLSTGVREKLLKNEKIINYGAPFENVVAQELYAHGFKDKLFYYNSKKHGEVDFIIEYNGDILPIEIKSGKTNEMNIYNHTALNNLIKLYNIETSYVFGECNVIKENDNIYQFPIYMIMFIYK